MMVLSKHDMFMCNRRLPSRLKKLMKNHPDCIVAGGFIRSCIFNESISDIDVFAPSEEKAKQLVQELKTSFDEKIKNKVESWILTTNNAFTLVGPKPSCQFIHRWTFNNAEDLIASFDFTICKAAFWHENHFWKSICSQSFYADLAAKRLIYVSPIREEDAGGSMIRVLKYYQRGFRIPLNSYAAVIARLVKGVQIDKVTHSDGFIIEPQLAKVLTGLLFEVDPNANVDKLPYIMEHTEDEETSESESV